MHNNIKQPKTKTNHALNLAVAEAIKSVKCISDSLETVREIAKLVKKSPQRNTKLDKIRSVKWI